MFSRLLGAPVCRSAGWWLGALAWLNHEDVLAPCRTTRANSIIGKRCVSFPAKEDIEKSS
jgi:hypothetical protein